MWLLPLQALPDGILDFAGPELDCMVGASFEL